MNAYENITGRKIQHRQKRKLSAERIAKERRRYDEFIKESTKTYNWVAEIVNWALGDTNIEAKLHQPVEDYFILLFDKWFYSQPLQVLHRWHENGELVSKIKEAIPK